MILWRSVYRGSLYRSVVSVYKRVTTILLPGWEPAESLARIVSKVRD